jgi:hypothetical protein
MNKTNLEKKKLKAQKTALAHYRNAVKKVLDRSEKTLRSFPESKIAAENKHDCEHALKIEMTIYKKAQLDATELPRGQQLIPLDD